MSDRNEWRNYTAGQWRQLAHNQADEIERLIAEKEGDKYVIDRLQADNERLRAALQYIAEFAHPDFDAGDLEGELDRAEKIWLQFQQVAQFALKGDKS